MIRLDYLINKVIEDVTLATITLNNNVSKNKHSKM